MLLFGWVGFSTFLSAQAYQLSNAIPVTANGQNLTAAWAGGLNSPQYSAMDLNLDGNPDLVVFDRFDDEVMTFLNQGSPLQPRYAYAPEYQSLFPVDLTVWMLLRDYNGDGYMDLFTSVPFANAVRVFRNNAPNNGGNHEFVLEADTLNTIYAPLRPMYVPRTDIPSIEDVDGDGDLDVLSFDVGGSFVEFHRNTSMENTGTADNLTFEVASRCYGHFRESGIGCTVQLGLPPCLPGNRPPAPDGPANGRHSGSTLLSIELNGDDNPDLLIGDISCNFVAATYGSDTSLTTHFDSVHYDFPNYNTPVDIPIFPAMFQIDADNDGVEDLLIAPNETSLMEDKAGTWYFRNAGSDSLPNFQLEQIGFLQNQMIETGTGTVPAFFDYNSDGLQDFLVGNIGRYDTTGGYTTSLWLFENIGTTAAPAFDLVTDDYLNIRSLPGFADANYLSPTFGDVDGDGDQDLLMGDQDGSLHFFRNQPSNGVANFSFETSSFGGLSTDLFTHPDLYDIDSDGDLDLFLGDIRGDLYYYENVGSTSSPSFSLVTSNFGGIEITDFTGQSFTNGFSRPLLLDYDVDGEVEILVGSIEGPVEIYEDVNLTPGATFPQDGILFDQDFGRYSTLTATNLDTSIAPVYIIGSGRGGLQLMTYTGLVDIGNPVEPSAPEWRIYPNPAQSWLQIELLNARGNVSGRVLVVDALGRVLKENRFNGPQYRMEVDLLPNGVYGIVVEEDGERPFSRKVVIQR